MSDKNSIQYEIIKGYDVNTGIEEFEMIIQSKINDSWRLFGPPTFISTMIEGRVVVCLYQAMIKSPVSSPSLTHQP